MKKRIMLFTSESCAPCRAFKPVLEEIVHEHSSQIELEVYDAEQNRSLAVEWGIRSVPAIIYNGIVRSGTMNKQDTVRYLYGIGVL